MFHPKLCRRWSLLAAVAALAAFAACGTPGKDPSSPELPNIIFILADDMGFGDLACQNPGSKIPTPNLDRMAGEGIRFTDAHSPSAVCSPTRYSTLTGRYAWRTPLKKSVLWPWDGPLIEPGRLTVGALLQEQGYTTACIGKWHLGWNWATTDGSRINDRIALGVNNSRVRTEFGKRIDFRAPIASGPITKGFDYYFGDDVPNFPPYCFIENDRTLGIPGAEKPDGMFGHRGPMMENWNLEEVLPALTRKAVEFIRSKPGEKPFNKAEGKPFFLFLSLTAPHTPIAPASEFRGKSRAGAYGDFVYQVDGCVGRVLEALEASGQGSNTLVIFTSDNGSPGRDGTNMSGPVNSVREYGHNPSHIYRGIKADVWEGGHRVPFIARWPGRIPPGRVSRETICHVDLMATCAALVGSKLPENAGEDSFNILPALLAETADKPIREATVHHSSNGMFAVRQGKWKLILGKGSGGWSRGGAKDYPPMQLYDLSEDPSETTNLYLEHPEIASHLEILLDRYRETGRSAPNN